MKTLKTLLIFALLLSALTTAFGQTGAAERFNQAKEAFDNSQFEKTLTMLDAIENDFGKSPRIESLRALTLRDLNRPRDAYLSVLAYFKLVEGKDYSNNAAHQSLVELRDTLKAQLETDLSVKKDNLQAERNANAEKAISETETNSLSKPNSQSSTTATDPLAELEMWNKVKTSTDANDYYLFLQRFPAGSFAKQAQAKMNEIGDPVWNEVRKSKDPFVYRDFIAKNPNSPFIVEAKDKMNMLAASAIAWEQIKETKTVEQLIAYVKKYPFASNIDETTQLAITTTQRAVQKYFPAQGRADSEEFSDLKFTSNCEIVLFIKYLPSPGYVKFDPFSYELLLNMLKFISKCSLL